MKEKRMLYVRIDPLCGRHRDPLVVLLIQPCEPELLLLLLAHLGVLILV